MVGVSGMIQIRWIHFGWLSQYKKMSELEKRCLSCLPFRSQIGANGGKIFETLQPNLQKTLVIYFIIKQISKYAVHTILYDSGVETTLPSSEICSRGIHCKLHPSWVLRCSVLTYILNRKKQFSRFYNTMKRNICEERDETDNICQDDIR